MHPDLKAAIQRADRFIANATGKMRRLDAAGAPVLARAPGRRVLVLDDEPGTLKVLGHFIEIAGYKPQAVTTLDQAARALTHCEVDGCCFAAVCDWKIGQSTSMPIVSILRRIGMPFSILTAWPENREVVALEKQGVTVFGKPPLAGFRNVINWIERVDVDRHRAAS